MRGRRQLRAADGPLESRLAPVFIEHAGIADGENILEVGCGTGSLTFALTRRQT